MPKLDLDTIPQTNVTGYPAPFDAPVAGRWYRRLAPACGLTCFDASHVTLKPGAWSSQRHWHAGEDEMVVMLAGEAVLIDDSGESPMRPGDIAVFPKGEPNGHHLINRSVDDCVFLAIGAGDRTADCGYPDIDLRVAAGAYVRKDGTKYRTKRPA